MDIGFGFDANYSRPVQVAMQSIMEHNSGELTRFWLLCLDNEAYDWAMRLKRFWTNRATIEAIQVHDTWEISQLPLSSNPEMEGITAATYLRLMLPAVASWQTDRLLYVDGDVMCTGLLADLWNTQLDGRIFGAVQDIYVRTIGSRGGIPHAPRSIPANAPYFNAGVLLIDVQSWLQSRISERSLEYLSSHRESIRYQDQDALNVVAYGRWKRLDPEWNYMATWRLSELTATRAAPKIIHFAGSLKPWHTSFPHGTPRDEYRKLIEKVEMVP